MDKQKITQLATQIMLASESITVAGEHNRVQLSGIYRTASQIIAEAGNEEEDGGQIDC